MHKVKIENRVLYAEDGALLHDLLISSNKTVAHPCGGKGICKKCTVTVDGQQVLSCQYKVTHDITVCLPEQEKINDFSKENTDTITNENVCYALDIGTTTLALALVSLENGNLLKTVTAQNPQQLFGSDVISRIDYCSKNGTDKLQRILLSAINRMFAQLGEIYANTLYVSGNTTMLHLFWGVDCSSIGIAPYTSAFLGSKNMSAESIGIPYVKRIVSLPNISAFIGSDIVAGLNLIGLPTDNKYSLLIDLGTNAEIVLFSNKTVLCTSAAAGPCFEGANISCGMSATKGAVFAYSKGIAQTIEDTPAKGICGTGLIDIIAELLTNGEIDKTGYLRCEEYIIADNVTLMASDVRQYQLAKSAIFSAILTLIKLQQISFNDISNVYISGGFSTKINIENAVKTGLLPEAFKSKCTALNNSSLLGTVKYSYEQNDLSSLISNAEYIDLSSSADFSQLFIENMSFE